MPGLPSYFQNRSIVLRANILISAFLFSFFISLFPSHGSIVLAADRKYKIKATAGPGGSISPSGDVRVEEEEDQTFRIFPDPSFTIKDVLVDGRSVGAVSRYTFEEVEKDHTIHATFSSTTVLIEAEADKGGEIYPSGKIMVDIGSDQTFNIVPDENRMVKEVKVDDEDVGAVSSYTFYNVSEDHKIKATFTKAFIITPVSGDHGSIEPSQPVQVPEHSDLVFDISPDPGYSVEDVRVDMKSVGPVSSYLFKDIKEDHFIEATFKINLGVQEVSIPDLPMKVGDEVTVTLSIANDAEQIYSLVSGTVGGYPLTGFQRISPSSFAATFTIAEGGNSYLASQAIPVTDLVISDGEVESPVYNSSISQGNDPIDSHSPVVTKLEAPALSAGPGVTVDINLMADGTGYMAGQGTVINGLPIDSDRVTLSERSSGAYVLSYVVAEGDNEVSSGGLEVTVVLVDPAGNAGSPYSALEPNTLEIYTSRPQVLLAGPPEICEGEEAVLSIRLEGRAPWDLLLDDGTRTMEYAGISSSEYLIEVAPVATTTYRIVSVTDANGVENNISDGVTVNVNQVTDVRIINLDAGYAMDAAPVELEANISGGVFYGPGVFSTTGTFHPELAGMSAAPHIITYTFENDNGCISIDSAEVYVLGSDAAFLMQDSIVCSNDDPVTVTVLNLAGDPGSFRLLDSVDQPVQGLEDHGNNTATIDPSLLEPGGYRIEYQYNVIDDVILSKSFTLEPVTEPLILAPDIDAICQSSDPVQLSSNLGEAVFEGPGVTWNSQDGFYFYPGEAGEGMVSIICTSISDLGCRATTVKEVELLPAPEVTFGMSSACIPEGGEMVSFNNYTAGIEHVESWQWDFGDPSSGTENQSSLMEPTHFYQETGRKVITLTAVSHDGCSDTYTLDSLIDSKPQADFTWISDCVPDESGVKLVNKSHSASGSIDTIIWRLSDHTGEMMYETGSASMQDTVALPLSTSGRYTIELYAVSHGGCEDEVSKELNLRSALQLDKEGFTETFDNTDGGWTVHAADGLKSWVWGIPDFSGYGQEPGDRAWYTQLPSGQQEYREHSWVVSPCFDFTGMERPLVRMNIMRSLVPVMNGAVLQYMDVLDEGWKTVGTGTPGIGWYNTTDILQQPGGSSEGWGLEVFDPDEDWVEVAHDLEQVSGSTNVTFRLALATNGRESLGNQGFAFDDFSIGERTKMTVLEHFTDYSDDSSRIADDLIDAIGKKYRKDVIDLQYHLSYHGLDPMNANNPDPASTRAFNYGVRYVPYTVLEGGGNEGLRFSLAELKENSMGDRLRMLTLEDPAFELELDIVWGESGLQAQTIVTCREERYENPIQLYLVVFETSVTGYSGRNGDSQFRNVVLDMLPYPAGKLLGNPWVKGKSEVRMDSWNHRPWVEDVNELAVAAFLQDRNTSQILQAVVRYRDQTVDNHTPDTPEDQFVIFPNPAGDFLYATFSALQVPTRLDLTDLSGRVIIETEVPSGTGTIKMDLQSLPGGIYLIRRTESGSVLGTEKLIKIR